MFLLIHRPHPFLVGWSLTYVQLTTPYTSLARCCTAQSYTRRLQSHYHHAPLLVGAALARRPLSALHPAAAEARMLIAEPSAIRGLLRAVVSRALANLGVDVRRACEAHVCSGPLDAGAAGAGVVGTQRPRGSGLRADRLAGASHVAAPLRRRTCVQVMRFRGLCITKLCGERAGLTLVVLERVPHLVDEEHLVGLVLEAVGRRVAEPAIQTMWKMRQIHRPEGVRGTVRVPCTYPMTTTLLPASLIMRSR